MATIGFSIGLDADVFRYVAAVFIIAIGIVLMVPRLQTAFAVAGGPMANWAHGRLAGLNSGGLAGQFGVGVLLGAVWSPCVGPTLGAASLLAAQGRDLGQVGVTMLVFGLGAGLPLLVLGLVSREAMMRWRHRMAAAGHGLKAGFGAVLVAIGALVDHRPRQDGGNRPCGGFTAMAHRPHDPVLGHDPGSCRRFGQDRAQNQRLRGPQIPRGSRQSATLRTLARLELW